MSAATAERRDWALFADWCESMDLDPLPASPDTVAEFLDAFPAAIGTQGHRVRAIRRAHERVGAALALPSTPTPTPWRHGDEWAAEPRALAQLTVYAHPRDRAIALRGRRDGWLIILTGELGLTRQEARAFTERDVVLFPTLALRDRAVPRADLPMECPACAVTRWLRVAGAASFGWWNDVTEAVRPTDTCTAEHDCLTGLDGSFRQAATLLPAIDRHGWVSGDAMSTRAVSSVLAYRQTVGDILDAPKPVQRMVATGRFADATMNELADAYDDVDEKAAALLLRLKEIVGESDEMLSHIKSFDP